jgi:hypothetical protein
MRRIVTALRIFAATLVNGSIAAQAQLLLRSGTVPPQPASATEPAPHLPPAAQRSEALNLLAALQREARFVDFIQEPLDGYSDAQVGAAVREVHRGCAALLERLFQLEPLLPEPEGTRVEVPAGFDAGRIQLTGKVAGTPPFAGRLVHHGWRAARCEVPLWSGTPEATRVVAAAEVELP